MTVRNPCADAIRARAGDLTDDELLEIAERIQEHRDGLRRRAAAGPTVERADEALRRAATEEGDKARLAAALVRKHAALNILARDALDMQIAELRADGLTPRKALLAVLEGSTRAAAGARKSVAATKLAYESRFIGDMVAHIQRERPHLAGYTALGDDRLMADAVREMFELRAGGAAGITGNADARFLAETFAAFAERSRTELNRLGATIGRLDGWAGPQTHNRDRMLRAGEDAWVAAILPRLDMARTFANRKTGDAVVPAEAVRILRDVYTTITTGLDRTITARAKGEFTAPRNLARSLEQHRVLHFKSADAWLAYHEDFGVGNLFTAMVAHQERLAALAAQMQVLGPNPQVMLRALIEALKRDVRADKTTTAARKAQLIKQLTDEPHTKLGSAYAEATGLTLVPADVTAAHIGSGIRAVQSMAKLGAALASTISDLPIMAANLHFNGMPIWRAYRTLFGELMQGRGRGEQREIAMLVGEGMDGLIGRLLAVHAGDDTAPGMISRSLQTFFRFSGLTWQADVMRAAGGRILAAHLGSLAERDIEALPEALRHVFGLHGIGPDEWNIIRAAAWTAENGRRYITPDRIASLPDEAFDDIIAPELDMLGELRRARPPRGGPPPPQDFTIDGLSRRPWTEAFPAVAVHQGPHGKRYRASADWAAAKNAGDPDAAARYVQDFMDDGTVDRIRRALAALGATRALVVPVHAAEPGRNTIPQAYARGLARRLGLDVSLGIVQTNRTAHTGAGAAHRLVTRATFDGPVEPGRAYLIVDDHITLGSTLADLRTYIEARGGRVVMASTLTASRDRQLLAMRPETLAALRARFGDQEDWWRQRFGNGFEGLTDAEARYLVRRFTHAHGIRNRLAEAAADRMGPGGPGGDGAVGRGAGPKAGGRPRDERPPAKTVDRLRDQARRDVEMALRRYLADEVSFGHIEPDPASRRLTLHGSRPGTAVGEALRFVMQFKAFPVAFGQRVLGRALLGGAGDTAGERLLNSAGHIGHLIAGLTIAGYMAMTAKDALKGWAPRDPEDDPVKWAKLVSAAMAQGGGGGIYGDFLFGEANRFGGGAASTALGPGLGAGFDLVDLWARIREGDMKAADGLNWMLQNTPYLNLFYARPALNYLVLNSLHESLSPGYLRRQERRRAREYGQERLHAASAWE